MADLPKHFRNTFLAGAFAVVPLAVTVFLVWWVDAKTREITVLFFGRSIPVVGILIALAAVYLAGLLVTSLIGKTLLKWLDHVLGRVPVLKPAYTAWKQVALTPGGSEGMFARVALIPDEAGKTLLLGFTSGQPVAGDEDTICVFVPNVPSPVTGRLYFVRREACRLVEISNEEAIKVILSTGNYVPAELGTAAGKLLTAAE